MNQEIRFFANGLFALILNLLLVACMARPKSADVGGAILGTGDLPSNGEHIYFNYPSAPVASAWKIADERLTCDYCHDPNGCIGVHNLSMVEPRSAEYIPWAIWQAEIDVEQVHIAISKVKTPNERR